MDIVQLLISPLATPIIPTKVSTVEACKAVYANAVAIVDTSICNCSMVSLFLTLKLNAQLKLKLKHDCFLFFYSLRLYSTSAEGL